MCLAYLAGSCEPDLICVRTDVLIYAPQLPESKCMPGKIRMKRKAEYQRRAPGLHEHFVKLIDQNIGILLGRDLIAMHHWKIVSRPDVWYREDAPRPGFHPDWLIVQHPIHVIGKSRFLQ